MKISALAMAGLVLAGSFAPFPTWAQNAPPAVKQRAPGVPTAPRADESARPPAGERATPPRAEGRGQRDDRAQAGPPQPSRDPPMPRPVPSIIRP
ncbi:hypothetical protein FQV39_18395 [Bosea sp. F3-2]|uniref:hypothetical protein n=1 Tax=Bosea sp. F3-2 TaxID=2599640 RepID=UPI0011EBB601|nr:hypothetical protein [Bosea sp. F3-2]QEL24331.1 hypothetical protein FQV39_18395 [Bosea sp. F3-2]